MSFPDGSRESKANPKTRSNGTHGECCFSLFSSLEILVYEVKIKTESQAFLGYGTERCLGMSWDVEQQKDI